MFLRSSCSQNFVKVLAHHEHGPVSGRNLFLDNFARGSSSMSPCPICICWWKSSLQGWFWRKWIKRIRNRFVEMAAYFNKQGVILIYLQALIILEVKRRKSSMMYTYNVTLSKVFTVLDSYKNWYKYIYFIRFCCYISILKKDNERFLNNNY